MNFIFLIHFQQVNEKGQTETIVPKNIEQAGLDQEPRVKERRLPIDEFRYIYIYILN